MKNTPIPPFVRHVQLGALAALLALASIAALRADAPAQKSTLSSGSTNGVSGKPASAAATTNLATIPPIPAIPAIPPIPPIPPVPDASHSMKITVDDDPEADADEKISGHGSAIEIHGGDHRDNTWVVLEAVLIPIVAILATFGTPVLIVFFVCYFKYRRRQENLALVREFLSKGLPVPPEILGETQSVAGPVIIGDPSNRCRSDLRRGFKLTFIGLGVTLALYVSDPHGTVWAWGLIPMIMGIGLLVSAWVESRQNPANGDSRTTPPAPQNRS